MGRRGNVFVDDEAKCPDDSDVEIQEEKDSEDDDSDDLEIGNEPVASQLHAWRKYEATKLGKKHPAGSMAAAARPGLKRSRGTFAFEEEEHRAPDKKKKKVKKSDGDPEILLQSLAGQIGKLAGEIETAAFAAKAVGTLSGLALNQAASAIAGQEMLREWDSDDHSEREIIGACATLKFLAGELRKVSAALSFGTPAYSNCQKQIKHALAQARED